MFNIFQQPLFSVTIDIQLFCELVILFDVNILPEKGWNGLSKHFASGRPLITTENRNPGKYSFRTFCTQGNLPIKEMEG